MNVRTRAALLLLCLLAPVPALAGAPHLSLCPDVDCLTTPVYETTPFTLFVNSTEELTDFSLAAVSVTNASLSALSLEAPAWKNFHFTVTPFADGEVTASIAAGAVHSADPAPNIASNSFSTTYDGTAPAVFLFSTTTSPTGSAIFIIATTSEATTGFTAGDVTVGNGTLGGFSAASSTEYSFLVTPTTDGTTTVGVGPGALRDAAGNTNSATVSLQYLFSNNPLATVTILNAASSTAGVFAPGERVAVSVAFSEAVAEVPTTTIAIAGPDALATTSMNRVDATHYLYIYTAAADGTDIVTIDSARDLAGNAQAAASTTLSVVISPPPPPPAPSGTGSSGGGGGGGGGIAPVTPVPAPVSAQNQTPTTSAPQGGEVLGASAFKFTLYLVRGSRGEEVQNLQQVLIDAGLLAGDSATGYFGAQTLAAVRAYQAAHTLPQTGTVGPRTRAMLNQGESPSDPFVQAGQAGAVLGTSSFQFTVDLTLGTTSPDVEELQKVLIAQKFLAIKKPTGYYGLLTATAVAAYQRARGLKQSGITDITTRVLLNK